MKKLNIKIPAGVTRAFGKASLEFKKHSPEILMIAGIGCGIASTVMACYATTKVEETIEKETEMLNKIHEYEEDPERAAKLDYDVQKDAPKDKMVYYARIIAKLIKLYGPAIATGGIGIACILWGHKIIKGRNAALASAAAAMSESLTKYRERVKNVLGEEAEEDIWYDRHDETVKTTVKNDDGTETEVEKTVKKEGHIDHPTIKYFDNRSREWHHDVDSNKFFLECQQRVFTERLQRRGYIFLNEVLEALDIEKDAFGNQFGWVYDPSRADNDIDFGIYVSDDPENIDFINGIGKSVRLHFNVDGDILSNNLFRKFDQEHPVAE